MIRDYYLKIWVPAEISKEFETNIGRELKTIAKEGTLNPILKAYFINYWWKKRRKTIL